MIRIFPLFSSSAGSSKQNGLIRGNGNINIEERKVSPFSKVEVSGAIKLDLTLGNEVTEAFVIADENVLPLILTEVIGDVLHIYSRDSYCTKSQPCVNLSAPEVLQVVSSGSSDITVCGINQTEISLSTSGSGEISASGSVQRTKIRVNGSGSIQCSSLDTDSLDVKVSGSGSVKAKAKTRADLKVAGAGEIQVWGNPTMVNSSRSGSGRINLHK